MNTKHALRRWSCVLCVAGLAGCGSSAAPDSQARAASGSAVQPSCDGYPQTDSSSGDVTVCDERSYDNLAATGSASVKTSLGDVLAQGSSRSTLALTAYVYATGATEQDAQSLASQVVIHTGNNDFYATGPAASSGGCTVSVAGSCVSGSSGGSGSWHVSFGVQMPSATDLSANASTGNIEADAVTGTASVTISTGNAFLGGLAGDVTATVSTGNVDADLGGATWQGNGLSIQLNSGNATLHAPGNYSAAFHFQTNSGSIHSDFSGYDQSGTNLQDDETTGHGGATISAGTNTGNLSLIRK